MQAVEIGHAVSGIRQRFYYLIVKMIFSMSRRVYMDINCQLLDCEPSNQVSQTNKYGAVVGHFAVLFVALMTHTFVFAARMNTV